MTAPRRRRGPQKPRTPRVEGPLAPGINIVNDGPAEGVPEPGGLPAAEPLPAKAETTQQDLSAHTLPIRFVRFRFGWGYQDTCPAIVFDGEYVAVLIPPLAHPIASCRFAFRAPPGGWSYVEAHPGSGIGEYQEV